MKYFFEEKWIGDDIQARLKGYRKSKERLLREIEQVDYQITKIEENIDYVIELSIKTEFREKLKELSLLQEEDINKRTHCSEGLTGNKKKKLEKGITIHPLVLKDEWLMDEFNDMQEYYKQQLEVISKLKS